jgi:hypothetical protein
VLDDKGGEDDGLKLQLLLLVFLPRQTRKFRVPNPAVPDLGVVCHMPCNQFDLAHVDLRTICNVCYCVVNPFKA